MSQRMTLITSPVFIPEAQLQRAGSFVQLFGNDRPLALEIGCGIGDFIVQVAARYPHWNFIAIDIFNQGCRQTCRRIEEAGLDNVLMLRSEARYLMFHYLGPARLRAIYLNCPDPWPKKRQRKRRLVNSDFLELVLYCLEDGGEFNFTTDFPDYGTSVADLLNQDSRFENLLSTPYSLDLGDYPLSKYMRRFLDQGQPIYRCHARKQTGLQLEPPQLNMGFRMRWPQADM